MKSRNSPYQWWVDIRPKNSKWLTENLVETDQKVKRILQLLEEDADSFARRAELYYRNRPQIIAIVEDFYRSQRSLLERYDHLRTELRASIGSNSESHGSGSHDISSILPSAGSSPNQRPSRRKSGPRAPAFLGSAGSSSDLDEKDSDESASLTDSEIESDYSSDKNHSGFVRSGDGQELQRKIVDLEIELRDVKEKLHFLEEKDADECTIDLKNENSEDLLARISGYEQEVRLATENIQLSNEEITRLKIELQKYKLSELNIHMPESKPDSEISQPSKLQGGISGLEAQILDPDSKVKALLEELRITKDKLQFSEEEISSLKNELETKALQKIQSLQNELQSARKGIAKRKSKLYLERKKVSKLQKRITRLKTSLSDRDQEIRDLKIAVSDAEQKIFPEKTEINAEMSRLLDEKTSLEEQVREWESRGRSLEEEIRVIKAEISAIPKWLFRLRKPFTRHKAVAILAS